MERKLLSPVSNRQFGDEIEISYRKKCMTDGSAPNMSIASATATKPGCHSDWRGCIVAYGVVDSGPDGPHCRDLDMNDFTYITDCFLSNAPTPMTEQQTASGIAGCKYVMGTLAGLAVVAAAVVALVYYWPDKLQVVTRWLANLRLVAEQNRSQHGFCEENAVTQDEHS